MTEVTSKKIQTPNPRPVPLRVGAAHKLTKNGSGNAAESNRGRR